MKTVWIVLAVVVGCGVLCCAGTVFFGKRLFDSLAETNDAADRFSKKVFEETAQEWDASVLIKYASSEFTRETSEKQTREYLASLSKRLGKFKSVGEFTATSTNANTMNGESTVTVKTGASTATFEKGTASVTMTVIKRNEKWGVVNLYVNPHG